MDDNNGCGGSYSGRRCSRIGRCTRAGLEEATYCAGWGAKKCWEAEYLVRSSVATTEYTHIFNPARMASSILLMPTLWLSITKIDARLAAVNIMHAIVYLNRSMHVTTYCRRK